jgi:hypothetical protein
VPTVIVTAYIVVFFHTEHATEDCYIEPPPPTLVVDNTKNVLEPPSSPGTLLSMT